MMAACAAAYRAIPVIRQEQLSNWLARVREGEDGRTVDWETREPNVND